MGLPGEGASLAFRRLVQLTLRVRLASVQAVSGSRLAQQIVHRERFGRPARLRRAVSARKGISHGARRDVSSGHRGQTGGRPEEGQESGPREGGETGKSPEQGQEGRRGQGPGQGARPAAAEEGSGRESARESESPAEGQEGRRREGVEESESAKNRQEGRRRPKTEEALIPNRSDRAPTSSEEVPVGSGREAAPRQDPSASVRVEIVRPFESVTRSPPQSRERRVCSSIRTVAPHRGAATRHPSARICRDFDSALSTGGAGLTSWASARRARCSSQESSAAPGGAHGGGTATGPVGVSQSRNRSAVRVRARRTSNTPAGSSNRAARRRNTRFS